ncbi:Outer membrane protein OprJ [Sterolibacterium denitrificans]|uniref:Outer membrane protein OprJ n=1 Tax=Sterolibacterium denitrificans TaxID=157592 RepID=A0A7Z7MVA0_9PROT|nr:efflux transporter outer membrane subunit [Sterolibacterium denitrificans]SMB26794.1 Outer membrane protein OprJ [Sterolibacterium denitrificans]
MHANLRITRTAILLSGLGLAACSLAPAYRTPDAPIPAQWSTAQTSAADTEEGNGTQTMDWQDFVRDDGLRQLIRQALANNRELRSALLQVDASRALYGIQRADRLPSLDLEASGQRQRLPADLNASGTTGVQSTYQVGLGLTAFELDLFGRVRNLSTAAEEEFFATEENAQAARISLISEVMRGWILRNTAWQRQQLAEQTRLTRARSLELIKRRQQAGLSSALDFQEARGLAEQAQVEAERAQRELAQIENALRLLLGSDTLSLPPAAPPNATLLATIAPGLPSRLLEQRPDIRAAEHQLRARNASIGAARAAFFPSISLTGLFGTASSDLSGLFDHGQRTWNFMPQLRLPIFAGGRNQANLDLAKVRKDIAIADYEKTIQTAFREVNDALVANATLQREETALRARLDAGQQRLHLAEARYRAGVDDHLRYLDAQRNDYANQAELIAVQGQRQLAEVSLFRALGGGWLAETATAGTEQ